MKSESLDWLANHPLYTKRFAFYVGKRSRKATIKEIAEELHLDWHTVKELDKQFMSDQLGRAGTPAPRVIGVDEIAIGRGHRYRIVVSDLVRRRAIWFGGKDRSEESMDEFYRWLGPEKCGKIRYVVMDMWKAFRASAWKPGHAPQATILFDRFHVLQHLDQAIDTVRKQEYARLSGSDRQFIKGQKYTLLSHWENLTATKKKALKLLFDANARLNRAYLLKESFFELWAYASPELARQFFDLWRDSLRWQRLKPYQKFAEMVDRHWEEISAWIPVKHQVPTGFVEGFNNKIREIQRRAYGFRDEEYLRLKILTCSLPNR